MFNDWTDTELFNLNNYLNIFLDIFILIVALVILNRIKKGPNFTNRGLYLISLNCIVDMIY